MSMLNDSHLMPLLNLFLTTEDASIVPISDRLNFIKSIKLLKNGSLDAMNQIDPIFQRINLIYGISLITDENTYDAIQIEWIQLIERIGNFKTDWIQVSAVCLRMIISGSSPNIIYQLSSLFAEYSPSDFDFVSLYKWACLSVVGKPVNKAFERAFRKEVDSQIKAFARIVSSVVDYVCLPVDTENSWASLDALEDVETSFAVLLKQAENCLLELLTDFSRNSDTRNELRVGLLELISKVCLLLM